MNRWQRPILALFAIVAAFCITFVWPQQNGLSFDIDSSPRAQAAKTRVPYDLSQVRVLKAVITKVNQNYVEPERIDHRKMLLAGLNAIQGRGAGAGPLRERRCHVQGAGQRSMGGVPRR